MTAAVRFENVSKRFTIHHERARSFQDLLIHRFRRNRSREEFWALRDVSFAAEPGTALGIVGSNGSGKSTLLKLATRILSPTSGNVAVDGRLSALLELGAGFHPDLSGRDNVFLNASILGMSRREIAARFDAIVAFAQLERFIDIPVKHYSSGMYARLGFAVAINVEPDVLLVDEVLAVGDEAFQARCFEAIRALHRAGKTLLFVSHDVAAVCEVCTQAIWLDGGRIRATGAPRTVVASYLAAARRSEPAGAPEEPEESQLTPPAPGRWGSGEAEIVEVQLVAAAGQPAEQVCAGEPLTIRIHYCAHTPIERPVFGLAVTTPEGVQVTGPNTGFGGLTIPRIAGPGCVSYTMDDLLLLPGVYDLSASIYDADCIHPFDYRDKLRRFTVLPSRTPERYGLVRLPGRWSAECGARATE